MDNNTLEQSGADSPPMPVGVTTVDDLIRRLRALRLWAGQPSYAEIADRIRRRRADDGAPPGAQRVSRTTVYDVFRLGRTRLDVVLLVEVVRAFGVPDDQVDIWRRTYGSVTGQDEPVRLVEVRQTIPAPEPYFIARAEQLAGLVAAPAGTTSLLVGMAGVGKTQLAQRAAELMLRDEGQTRVFVSLNGGDRRHSPASAESVLRAVLNAVDVPASAVRNLSIEERAEVWIAWTRRHDPVVVLDDAYDEAQLELLVRPGHGGRIIVTSRRVLPGLTHAASLTVDPFDESESVSLLERLSGADGVDHVAVARIAQLCGNLPLELAVTGMHIADRRGWSLDDHARRLEQLPRGANVGRALAAMTAELDPPNDRLFRRLALHPGARVAAWSVSALADLPVDSARIALESLAAAHLVRSRPADRTDRRYDVHDLVREHAADLLRDHDAHSVQRDAVRRLAERAMAMTQHAVETALPDAVIPVPITLGEPVDAMPRPDSADSALAWLDVERVGLVDLVGVLSSVDLPEHAGALALIVTPYLTYIDDTPLVVNILECGLATPDVVVRAALHRDLASAHSNQGRFEMAATHLERAIATAPDPTAGRTHSLLAGIYSGTGRLAEALQLHITARDEADRAGDDRRRIRETANIGNVSRLLGRHADAEAALRDASAAAEERGDTIAVIYSESTLGLLFEDMAQYRAALDCLARANERAASIGTDFLLTQNLTRMAAIHRNLGDIDRALEFAHRGIERAREGEEDNSEAEARVELGLTLISAARLDEAAAELEVALDQARQLGAAIAEAAALQGLGEAALASGDPAAAAGHFVAALERATTSEDRLEVGRIRRGLGDAARAWGDDDAADEHYRIALEVLDELCPVEAASLRERL